MVASGKKIRSLNTTESQGKSMKYIQDTICSWGAVHSESVGKATKPKEEDL